MREVWRNWWSRWKERQSLLGRFGGVGGISGKSGDLCFEGFVFLVEFEELPNGGVFPGIIERSASGLSIAEPFPELSDKRVAIDILDGAVWFSSLIEFSSAGGLSEENPVGGLIARPLEPLAINKGFNPMDRMRIERLPVFGKPFQALGQKMRCKMRDPDPGQYQKAGVVGK